MHIPESVATGTLAHDLQADCTPRSPAELLLPCLSLCGPALSFGLIVFSPMWLLSPRVGCGNGWELCCHSVGTFLRVNV